MYRVLVFGLQRGTPSYILLQLTDQISKGQNLKQEKARVYFTITRGGYLDNFEARKDIGYSNDPPCA